MREKYYWLVTVNKVRILRLSNTLEKDADRLTGRECTIFKFQLYI